jgi:drug/metabolite transporter (DMT)-like permease
LSPPARPLQGVAFAIAAVACFAALDTTTKTITAAVPVVMAMWFRYTFQAAITAATLLPTRGVQLLHTRRPMLQCLRGLLLLVCSGIAYLSLRYMPVGEFTAIVMLTPLAVTLLAAISLGERVSALRWLLVAGGFAGALIVIRPAGDDFSWALLLPLALVGTNAAFQILTSKLARVEDAGTMHFYSGLTGAVAAALALPWFWQPLDTWAVWLVLGLLAVLSTAGHFLLILAYGRAPAATITPYLYFQIAFATLGGWLMFSHVPDGWAFAGLALIAFCGAVGTWLTARESRAAPRPDAPLT